MKNILQGEKIYLDGFLQEDVQFLMKWQLKEPQMRQFDALPLKPKTEHDWVKWIADDQPNQFRFAIRDKEHQTLIGHTTIDGILWNHRVGWVSIFIGEEGFHRKGYGTEAMEKMLEFAFCELNLYRLQLTVFSYNQAAIRLYEKLGFQKEGTYREFLERNLQRHDMHLYGILRTEWMK